MDRLYVLVERISRYAAWCSGIMLLLGAAMVSADVVARKVLNLSVVGGSVEIVGYILAISTSWALSFSLVQRANIRIDALYTHLPRRMAAWLDLFGLVLLGVFMSVVTWYVGGVWLNSIDMHSTANTPLQTLLMIPQGLWLIGFVLFLVVLLILMVRVVKLLFAKDWASIGRIAGIPTVDEEVQAEVSNSILEQMHTSGGKDAS